VDKLAHYAQIVEEVIQEWGEAGKGDDATDLLTIIDRESSNYLLVSAGWHRTKRLHTIIYHARIHDGKLWVEWDGTDPSINEELLRRGIPIDDMVFGFNHPTLRDLTVAPTSH
jgi:hypothetical protein